MSDQKTEVPLNGLLLIGKVNAKSTKRYKNGEDHFFLAVFAPGSDVMYRVEVGAKDWEAYQQDSVFKSRVSTSVFNNQVTYMPM